MVPMQYKGYDISTTTVHGRSGKITEVGYCLHKSGIVVQTAVLLGPFDSDEDARAAAEWAAREWIGQPGKVMPRARQRR